MRAAIVIPARLRSTRLPEKLLLKAGGKTLLQHTYENALRATAPDRVLIAADDARIAAEAKRFGAQVVLTDPAHTSGTARAAEAARAIKADIVVNLQGDEPEIDPAAVDLLIALQEERAPFCSTLVCPFPATSRPDDPSAVKAILGKRTDLQGGEAYEALYFTRAPAPFPRDAADLRQGRFHLHIGAYAFAAGSLQVFAAAPEGRLERIERLEQLRILEMGEKILAAMVLAAAPGIDTLEDFEAFRARIEKNPG